MSHAPHSCPVTSSPPQVIVSVLEHHSNLVPWQMVCKQTGATLRHVGLAKDGNGIDMVGENDCRSRV